VRAGHLLVHLEESGEVDLVLPVEGLPERPGVIVRELVVLVAFRGRKVRYEMQACVTTKEFISALA
jgi:hypothetical protein